jgi:hypothetical protein
MKIIIDTKTNKIKVGSKTYGENMDASKANEVLLGVEKALEQNTKLSLYEEDSMWMSYRYCIGRHTIASHMRAGDIAQHCYGRMSEERSIFTAYDINREIERCMTYGCGPMWYFPITPVNAIYTTAIDIFCQFIEDYKITSKEDLLKYKDVHVKLTDNERGYSLETVTWEEWLRPQILKYCERYYAGQAFTEDDAWDNFMKWKNGEITNVKFYEDITKDMPNKDYFSILNIEDLFVWNNLVHLFDKEHHHKSILKDDTECEWYWSYTNDYEQREDGLYYRKEIGYRKVRIPVDLCAIEGISIPDESIKKDLY